eukprot:COSAG05_NODE_23926_length_255_cov_0.429487_1_plen_41_part_10
MAEARVMTRAGLRGGRRGWGRGSWWWEGAELPLLIVGQYQR